MNISSSKSLLMLFCVVPFLLHSESPEYFRVLAHDFPGSQNKPGYSSRASGCWQPAKEDICRGFAVGAVDISVTPRPDFIWEKPGSLNRKITAQASRGEIRTFSFVLRALQNLNHLRFVCRSLKSSSGRRIETDHLLLQSVKAFEGAPARYKELFKAEFLSNALPSKLAKGHSSFFYLSIAIPKDTLPGFYEGEIIIENGTCHETITLEIEVLNLDFQWPGKVRGLFLPGVLYSQKRGNNWSTDFWNKENLKHYFRFFRSRGYNSPIFYHVSPKIKFKNGKGIYDWSEINRIIQEVRSAGIEGPAGLDLRLVAAAVSGAAKGLFKEDGVTPKEVHAAQAEAYPDQAKEYFREAVKDLLEFADKNHWGPVFLFADEEVNNTPGQKKARVDAFTPVLVNIAGPEQTAMIDNPYGGWWIPDDRGERYNIAKRIYVLWTREGLERTRKNGASVLTYNSGLRRANGLYQLACGSDGHYQWADNWCNWQKSMWTYSMTTPDGCFTSLPLEREREGFGDWFYGEEHIRMEEFLRKTGRKDDAERMKKSRMKILGIMENSVTYNRMLGMLSDAELDAIRRKFIMEIDYARRIMNLSPLRPKKTINEKEKKLSAEALPLKSLVRPRNVDSIFVAGPPQIDGVPERLWRKPGNVATDFQWQTSAIPSLKKGRTEEEFKKLLPSGTSTRFLHGEKGLYIYIGCNHVNPTACRERTNGDGDMRYDDSIEIFFFLDELTPRYRFIINAKGRHCWLRDQESITNSIRCATRFRKNGGIDQEIFIPWSDFGLEDAPANGTKWLINICRLWRGQLSDWVQYHTGRGSLGDGGILNFINPAVQNDHADGRIAGAPRFVSVGNIFSCEIALEQPDQINLLYGTLTDSEGRSFKMPPISLEGGRNKIWFSLPDSTAAGNARLDLRTDKGIIFPTVKFELVL